MAINYPISFRIELASDKALIIYAEQADLLAANKVIQSLCNELTSNPVTWLNEYIPSYQSVLLEFDLLQVDVFEVKQELRSIFTRLLNQQNQSKEKQTIGKKHRIPVCYDPFDDIELENVGFVSDLTDLSCRTKLSKDEIVRRHTQKSLRVFATGFLPNFAYLGDIDDSLASPRLDKPRSKVPKGAVAIADKQSAIYPQSSPGGWNILGYTPIDLSVHNSASTQFAVGDEVEFFAISPNEYRVIKDKQHDLHQKTVSQIESDSSSSEFISILQSRFYASLVDAGRKGVQHLGYCEAGSGDKLSYELANALLGKEKDVPVIEVLMAGFECKVSCDTQFAVTGANNLLTIDDVPAKLNEVHFCKAGSRIKLSERSRLSDQHHEIAIGLYNYIAFNMELIGDKVLGSCSAVAREGLGGKLGDGSGLKSEQQIGLKVSAGSEAKPQRKLSTRQLRAATSHLENLAFSCARQQPVFVRFVRGYQSSLFTHSQKAFFCAQTYEVSSEISPMGIKLNGLPLNIGAVTMYSEGIASGAIQITPSGQPIIMMHQRQTIGGYPKMGSVISCDIPLLAQCRPGTLIQLVECDILSAHNYYHLQHAALNATT